MMAKEQVNMKQLEHKCRMAILLPHGSRCLAASCSRLHISFKAPTSVAFAVKHLIANQKSRNGPRGSELFISFRQDANCRFSSFSFCGFCFDKSFRSPRSSERLNSPLPRCDCTHFQFPTRTARSSFRCQNIFCRGDDASPASTGIMS